MQGAGVLSARKYVLVQSSQQSVGASRGLLYDNFTIFSFF